MQIFERLSNGWQLGKMSMRTIADHPVLMLFPAFSGVAMIFLTLSFCGGSYLLFGDSIEALMDNPAVKDNGNIILYIFLFLFYLVNFFVVVFFNVGLIYCAQKAMNGGQPTFGEGISYAGTRVGTIAAWAAAAATVGVVLKFLQNNLGTVGKIITGLLGMVWSIATFFVVPVLANENVGPVEAVKRSAQLLKDKWGESLAANFSFGLFSFLGFLLLVLPLGFLIGYLLHPIVGIITGILAFILLTLAVSAGKTVFLAAIYNDLHGQPTGEFRKDTLDSIFIHK